jgi:predicted phosphodiesterase
MKRNRLLGWVILAAALIAIWLWFGREEAERRSDPAGKPILHGAADAVSFAAEPVPTNFKVAFFGDQGLGADAEAVLRLVKSEGVQLVLHLGDFDYADNPVAWDEQITRVLGPDFPYLAVVGNHDEKLFRAPGGYQARMEARLRRVGIRWNGDLGVQSILKHNGLFFVLTAPGVIGTGHERYIREKLAADQSHWRIAAWHKNQQRMQVGGKSDETGWEVYEEARKGGAIIATGHEHSYSRTFLLGDMQSGAIASRERRMTLTKGQTFAFVSGLGGKSIRPQQQTGDWWASVFTASQDARPGALFGVFNAEGDPTRARFYFKDILGRLADQFEVVSQVNAAPVEAAAGR